MQNFNEMTLQQAMDYAVQKLVEQGDRCIKPGPGEHNVTCMYGDGKGNHCAIGWFLIDKPELWDFDGGLISLIRHCKETKQSLPKIIIENAEAFDQLQSFHDGRYGRHEMLIKLSNFGVDTSGDHWQKWAKMGLGT